MTGLKIDDKKCVACGLCVKSCPSDALGMENKKVLVSDSCILCGICIDSCPVDAIAIEKEEKVHEELSQYKDIWVFAEQHRDKVLPVAYELLSKGKELSQKRGCKLVALLFGRSIKGEAEELLAHGADRVLVCEDEGLEHQLDAPYVDLCDRLIGEYKPEILLFGATAFGRSIAPRIAARVGTGLTADCTVLEIDEETGLLHQTRPAFGGNLMATIVCPNHRPQMATVRPGVMSVQSPAVSHQGEIIEVSLEEKKDASIEILQEILSQKAATIGEAKIIVSAGRGIGSQKNLVLVNRLAELLGGHVGVTRPLVDIGWSQYRQQIGQTGSTVAPELLITCGISGAIQHLAGIGGAKTIIAINSDPDAPIFSMAHYKVVGDCVEIVKKLIGVLEQSKKQGLG
ncbi:MAG: electron transfer flavoprotein subunit alpha [Thermotaleaceae bacterium]